MTPPALDPQLPDTQNFVLVDRNLITSRRADDVPVFCAALVGALQAARSSS